MDDAGAGRRARVAIRAQNWAEMLDMVERAGLLGGIGRRSVDTALGFLAGMSGRREDLDVTLALRGRVHVPRPLPIGEGPRLRLALAAVAARPVARHVEVEVILVEAVRIRAENGAEGPTGAPVQVAQHRARAAIRASPSGRSVRSRSPARCPRCRWHCRARVPRHARQAGCCGSGRHRRPRRAATAPRPGAAHGRHEAALHPCVQGAGRHRS